MISDLQLSANRRNAKKSTGPRTKAGKDKSKLNGLKHGLLAKTIILPFEDKAEFDLFAESIYKEFKTDKNNLLETSFTDSLVDVAWRLQRFVKAEKEELDSVLKKKPAQRPVEFEKLIKYKKSLRSQYNQLLNLLKKCRKEFKNRKEI